MIQGVADQVGDDPVDTRPIRGDRDRLGPDLDSRVPPSTPHGPLHERRQVERLPAHLFPPHVERREVRQVLDEPAQTRDVADEELGGPSGIGRHRGEMLPEDRRLGHEGGDRRPELVGDVGRETPPPLLGFGERGDAARSPSRERERDDHDRDPADRERRRELAEVLVDPCLREGDVELGIAIGRRTADQQGRDTDGVDPLVAELASRRDRAKVGWDEIPDPGSASIVCPSCTRIVWMPRSSRNFPTTPSGSVDPSRRVPASRRSKMASARARSSESRRRASRTRAKTTVASAAARAAATRTTTRTSRRGDPGPPVTPTRSARADTRRLARSRSSWDGRGRPRPCRGAAGRRHRRAGSLRGTRSPRPARGAPRA